MTRRLRGEEKIDTENATIERYYGFMISLPKEIDRKSFVWGMQAGKKLKGALSEERFLYFKMTCCGKEYQFSFATFPLIDMLCACGKPNYWVIKWDMKEDSEGRTTVGDLVKMRDDRDDNQD